MKTAKPTNATLLMKPIYTFMKHSEGTTDSTFVTNPENKAGSKSKERKSFNSKLEDDLVKMTTCAEILTRVSSVSAVDYIVRNQKY